MRSKPLRAERGLEFRPRPHHRRPSSSATSGQGLGGGCRVGSRSSTPPQRRRRRAHPPAGRSPTIVELAKATRASKRVLEAWRPARPTYPVDRHGRARREAGVPQLGAEDRRSSGETGFLEDLIVRSPRGPAVIRSVYEEMTQAEIATRSASPRCTSRLLTKTSPISAPQSRTATPPTSLGRRAGPHRPRPWWTGGGWRWRRRSRGCGRGR